MLAKLSSLVARIQNVARSPFKTTLFLDVDTVLCPSTPLSEFLGRSLDERTTLRAGPHKGASIVLQLEFLAIECVRKSIHPTRT